MHWQSLSLLVKYFFFTIAVILFFEYIYTVYDLEIVIWVFAVGYLMMLLPQIPLHLDYKNVNKNDVFRYNPISQMMSFEHQKQVVNFFSDDVISVVEYKSPNLYKGYPLWATFDVYYHMIVTLKDGTRIILTSLMVGKKFSLPNVDKSKVTVKTNGYRWATGPSLKRPSPTQTNN